MNNKELPKLGDEYQNKFKTGCATVFKYIVVAVNGGSYTVMTLNDEDVLKWCSVYKIEYFDNLEYVGACGKIDINGYEG